MSSFASHRVNGKSPAGDKPVKVEAVKKPTLSEAKTVPKGEFLKLAKLSRAPKTINLNSTSVSKISDIDPNPQNTIWSNAPAITTLDYATGRLITIKSVHTKSDIAFLVMFPDKTKSVSHKTLKWDKAEGVYRQLPDREDSFIFKWSMVGNKANLSIQKPIAHKADIWYWKAQRTNPIEHADDKMQIFQKGSLKGSAKVLSSDKGDYYLLRKSDEGTSAYKENLYYEYEGNVIQKYTYKEPSGSRGDIAAKGIWKDGIWVIMFSRKLNTGSSDDLQFKIGDTYLFGVSLYEIAGGNVDKTLTQPLYKAGDVYDHILLNIK